MLLRLKPYALYLYTADEKDRIRVRELNAYIYRILAKTDSHSTMLSSNTHLERIYFDSLRYVAHSYSVYNVRHVVGYVKAVESDNLSFRSTHTY